jgi:hypothetical protein
MTCDIIFLWARSALNEKSLERYLESLLGDQKRLTMLYDDWAFLRYLSYWQCCGSGMFIPDPKISTKERGEKKLVVIPFFVSTNFTKLKIILFFKGTVS